jgi:iron-sulfur cluster assembly protein
MEVAGLTTANLVEITPLAAQRLEAVLREQDAEGSLLRIMVTPGAHGGVQYMLGVEQAPADGDVVIDAENIKVLVDAESAPLVDGAEIDYVDGLMRSGFVISNPNVQSGGCACGGGGCGGGGGGCGGGGGEGGCACGGGGH